MTPPLPNPMLKLFRWLELLWEIPLSVVSFLFSRVLRTIMQSLIGWYTRADRQKPPEWQLVSAQFLAKPVKLLWAMTRARWNLHAIVAIVNPLSVQSRISLDAVAMSRSAQSWTVVVYALPSYRTITSIGSRTLEPDTQWATISLEPGTYLLGLRYYHWADTIELPTVKVDDQVVVSAQTQAASPDINAFYRDLGQRKNTLHSALNYYVFNLLRFKRWLPQSFVTDVFLPVPNPETRFYYGALYPGERVQIEADDALLATHDIYFSLYTRECFPADWYQVKTPKHISTASEHKLLYLMRVHRLSAEVGKPVDEQIKLQVLARES
jgi:Family of unknown function (DUF6208)